jgi:DNA-binding protein YbaB
MGDCRKCAQLQEEIERIQNQIRRMRVEHEEDLREAGRDAREAIVEARWQERMGEDYGGF